MASFDTYWKDLLRKNPALGDDATKMTISVSAFRQAVERAYNRGDLDRYEAQKVVDELNKKKGPFSGLFGDMFS